MPGSASRAAVSRRRPVLGRVRTWILASRPATLPAAVVPVVVGSAVARAAGAFRAGPAIAALIGALLIQVGTNLSNDVADFEKGADHDGRIGPLRVTQAGLLTPRAVRIGMCVAFALATSCGVYLARAAGPAVFVIGGASIAAGILYTAGPFPLGYNGLGDLFVMIFFGFVAVCGTAWVEARTVPSAAWYAAVPVGALITAILVVNNIRDAASDGISGKRTIAVRFGRTAARGEYIALLAAAYLVPLILAMLRLASRWVLLTFATLPLAIRLARIVGRSDDGPALNRCLAGTARLALLHGALFAAGLIS